MDPHTHQAISSQPHGRRVVFNTRHLVLAGLLDEDRLREELLREKLVFEVRDVDASDSTGGVLNSVSFLKVHDRDLKTPEDVRKAAEGERVATGADVRDSAQRRTRTGLRRIPIQEWFSSYIWNCHLL